MALPVTIPNTFANATASIPLSQLDTNFNTLANAVNGISDGSETLANASVTVLTAGTVDINGGAIDGTTVGTSNAAAGSFTTLNTSGAVVFNDAGADVDFRVEGDTDANLLFVDASADAVGIGANAPAAKLHITDSGNTTADGIRLTLGSEARDHNIYSALPTGRDLIIAPWRGLSINTGSGFTEGILTLNGYEYITFGTGSSYTERIRVTDNGITFNGDTAAANALDDYEEGTWTPVLSGTTNPTVGYLVQVGNYTKIGNVVTVWARVTINSISGGSGALFFSGLPFTGSLSNNEFAGPMEASFVTFGAGYTAANSRVLSNATDIYLNITGSNAVANTVNVSAVGSSADFVFGCTYRAA